MRKESIDDEDIFAIHGSKKANEVDVNDLDTMFNKNVQRKQTTRTRKPSMVDQPPIPIINDYDRPQTD